MITFIILQKTFPPVALPLRCHKKVEEQVNPQRIITQLSRRVSRVGWEFSVGLHVLSTVIHSPAIQSLIRNSWELFCFSQLVLKHCILKDEDYVFFSPIPSWILAYLLKYNTANCHVWQQGMSFMVLTNLSLIRIGAKAPFFWRIIPLHTPSCLHTVNRCQWNQDVGCIDTWKWQGG